MLGLLDEILGTSDPDTGSALIGGAGLGTVCIITSGSSSTDGAGGIGLLEGRVDCADGYIILGLPYPST